MRNIRTSNYQTHVDKEKCEFIFMITIESPIARNVFD